MVQSVGNVFFDISDKNFSTNRQCGISGTGNISSQVQVYPNPANDLLHVNVNGLSNEPLHISVYDVVGRILFEWHENNLTGTKVNLNLGNEPGGIYLYR
jgi:hypothetical protein